MRRGIWFTPFQLPSTFGSSQLSLLSSYLYYSCWTTEGLKAGTTWPSIASSGPPLILFLGLTVHSLRSLTPGPLAAGRITYLYHGLRRHTDTAGGQWKQLDPKKPKRMIHSISSASAAPRPAGWVGGGIEREPDETDRCACVHYNFILTSFPSCRFP